VTPKKPSNRIYGMNSTTREEVVGLRVVAVVGLQGHLFQQRVQVALQVDPNVAMPVLLYFFVGDVAR